MKTRTLAATALLLLTLTGCAGVAETEPTDEPVDTQTATSTPEPTPEQTVDPAPIEVTPTTPPDPSESSDAELLHVAHATLDVAGITLTDEEVLAAVAWICGQRAAGVTHPIALEGASEGTNYGFQSVAEQMRCPEYFQNY